MGTLYGIKSLAESKAIIKAGLKVQKAQRRAIKFKYFKDGNDPLLVPIKDRLAVFKKQKFALTREDRTRANREARLESKWPEHKLRRSRVDWSALIPDNDLVESQMRWEKSLTIIEMRRQGMTLSEIAVCFGVSASRASALLHSAERRVAKGRGRSPMEKYMQQSAVPMLHKETSVYV